MVHTWKVEFLLLTVGIYWGANMTYIKYKMCKDCGYKVEIDKAFTEENAKKLIESILTTPCAVCGSRRITLDWETQCSHLMV